VVKNKTLDKFQTFSQKALTMLLESLIRDPEKTYSGSRIPDPWVKKTPHPRSGSATLYIMPRPSFFELFFQLNTKNLSCEKL